MTDHPLGSIDATLERADDRLYIHFMPVGVAPLRAQLLLTAIPVSFTIGMTVLGMWLVTREDNWTTIAFLAVWTLWEVPSQEPCRTGELKVTVLITDEDGTPQRLSGVRKLSTSDPLIGRILLERGQLSVRNSVYRRSPIRFVRRGQWFENWRALLDGSLPLAADDFTWTEKDGQRCLHVAVRLPYGDGFDLWLWPDDEDALRSMVDTFLTT